MPPPEYAAYHADRLPSPTSASSHPIRDPTMPAASTVLPALPGSSWDTSPFGPPNPTAAAAAAAAAAADTSLGPPYSDPAGGAEPLAPHGDPYYYPRTSPTLPALRNSAPSSRRNAPHLQSHPHPQHHTLPPSSPSFSYSDPALLQLGRRAAAAVATTTTAFNSSVPAPVLSPVSPSHRASIPSVSLPGPPSPRRRSSTTKAITGSKSDSPGGRRSSAASGSASNTRRRSSARKGSTAGSNPARGSRWTQSPSESTLRQYDDTIVTMKKWLAAHKPELADSFDHVSELTLDAMLLYMDDAVDRGLSYNTVSRVNSALAAYFKFRLKRELPMWEEIQDPNERYAKGNPCFSTRYRARYHSISRNGGDRRRRRDSEQDLKVKPILYPDLAIVLNYLRDETADDLHVS